MLVDCSRGVETELIDSDQSEYTELNIEFSEVLPCRYSSRKNRDNGMDNWDPKTLSRPAQRILSQRYRLPTVFLKQTHTYLKK